MKKLFLFYFLTFTSGFIYSYAQLAVVAPVVYVSNFILCADAYIKGTGFGNLNLPDDPGKSGRFIENFANYDIIIMRNA